VGIEIAPSVMVRGPNEIDAAFAAMKKEGAGAVVVHGSLSTKNVAELALKHGLPAVTQTRSFAEVGGLMSYGADGPDVFRQPAHAGVHCTETTLAWVEHLNRRQNYSNSTPPPASRASGAIRASGRRLATAEWALVEPMIPSAKRGGRRREVNVREVLNAIFYVLSTGCM
jgi:hypothetical protein